MKGLGKIGAGTWINAGVSVATSVAGALKKGDNYSENNTTNIYHERQLTPEELAIKEKEFQAREDQRIYDNAYKSMVYNDAIRAKSNVYQKPKADNTALYIVGGLLFVTVMFKIMNQKK